LLRIEGRDRAIQQQSGKLIDPLRKRRIEENMNNKSTLKSQLRIAVEDAVGEQGGGGRSRRGRRGGRGRRGRGGFRGVEAPVGEEVHVGGAVVDLVDAPEEGDAVEEVVDEPLGEIEEDEESEELGGGRGGRRRGWRGGRVRRRVRRPRRRPTTSELREEVDEVGEEAGAEEGLGAAGEAAFEEEEEEGEGGEPEGVGVHGGPAYSIMDRYAANDFDWFGERGGGVGAGFVGVDGPGRRRRCWRGGRRRWGRCGTGQGRRGGGRW
jgi:hypothetical protein